MFSPAASVPRLAVLILLVLLIASFVGPQGYARADSWTVQLTRSQAKNFAETQAAAKSNWAFAISPDGGWGRSWEYATAEGARTRAMQECRLRLRKDKRDCALFAENGKRLMPAVIETRRVSKVYKPVNGRSAAAVIGLAPMSFRGNPQAAKAQVAAINEGSLNVANLPGDRALMTMLRDRSLATTSGFESVVYFGRPQAQRLIESNSGLLSIRFTGWRATREGAVCMENGRWATGKPFGNFCLVIHAIDNGRITFSWGDSNASRSAYLIAGDARFAHVR